MIEIKRVFFFKSDFYTVVLVYGDLLVLKEAILSYSWLNPLSILKVWMLEVNFEVEVCQVNCRKLSLFSIQVGKTNQNLVKI